MQCAITILYWLVATHPAVLSSGAIERSAWLAPEPCCHHQILLPLLRIILDF